MQTKKLSCLPNDGAFQLFIAQPAAVERFCKRTGWDGDTDAAARALELHQCDETAAAMHLNADKETDVSPNDGDNNDDDSYVLVHSEMSTHDCSNNDDSIEDGSFVHVVHSVREMHLSSDNDTFDSAGETS